MAHITVGNRIDANESESVKYSPEDIEGMAGERIAAQRTFATLSTAAK